LTSKGLRTYDEKLENREPLSLKEYLIDLGYAKDLVDSIIENPGNSSTESNALDDDQIDSDDQDEIGMMEGV
jgi:hypothetical protein